MNISFVPPKNVDDIWEVAERLLAPAVKLTNGRYMVEDIRVAAKNGDMQLWIAFTEERDIIGCGVTAISEYPSRRLLTVLFVGGSNVRAWRESMIKILSRWGEDNQCSGIEAYGREGWSKMLEAYDIKRGLTMFERDI